MIWHHNFLTKKIKIKNPNRSGFVETSHVKENGSNNLRSGFPLLFHEGICGLLLPTHLSFCVILFRGLSSTSINYIALVVLNYPSSFSSSFTNRMSILNF